MAALFLLLAIIGASVVADVVMENTGTGAITVMNHRSPATATACS
jgi:hypothetical protein